MMDLNDDLTNELFNSTYDDNSIKRLMGYFDSNNTNTIGVDYNLISGLSIPKFTIEFMNKSNNPNPTYAIEGASGFDLRAYINEDVFIKSGEYKVIPTGLYFNIPNGFEMQVRSRSGLAAKHGVCVLNSPGTIDSGYFGEIMVILINHGKGDFKIENGDRIAQGVICNVLNEVTLDLTKVDELNVTSERGDGKFGSTGVK